MATVFLSLFKSTASHLSSRSVHSFLHAFFLLDSEEIDPSTQFCFQFVKIVACDNKQQNGFQNKAIKKRHFWNNQNKTSIMNCKMFDE